jgi:hypothetical protein
MIGREKTAARVPDPSPGPAQPLDQKGDGSFMPQYQVYGYPAIGAFRHNRAGLAAQQHFFR